jgi:ribosomal protein S18 acetylase RimI-like enzyme
MAQSTARQHVARFRFDKPRRSGDHFAMVRVREAIIADAEDIARIDVETWRTTYAGVLPDRVLIGLSLRQRSQMWASALARFAGDTVVAVESNGQLVGFGSCGERRDGPAEYGGEIFTLYVLPDLQGRGIGRQMLLALFARLLRRRLPSAILWVLRDNPSRYFYERLGGRLTSQRPIKIGGASVEAVAYGWNDIAAVVRAQARASGRLPKD